MRAKEHAPTGAARGSRRCVGGTLTSAYTDAVQAVMSACVSEDLARLGLKKPFMTAFGVQREAVLKALPMRARTLTSGAWETVHRKQYSNAISAQASHLLWQYSHTDTASYENNCEKRQVRVYPPCPDPEPLLVAGMQKQKSRLRRFGMVRHYIRTQIGDNEEYVQTFRKTKLGEQFRSLTRSKANPDGIKLSANAMRQHQCRCVKHEGGKTEQCPCQKCATRRFNQKRFHLARGVWHQNKRKEMGEDWVCFCGGECTPGSNWLSSTKSMRSLDQLTMCPARPCTALSHPALPHFKMIPKLCRDGECNLCGIGFDGHDDSQSNPSDSDTSSNDTINRNRCPTEWDDNKICKLYKFQDVLRGRTREGKPYKKREFVCNVKTCGQFMKAFFGKDGI